MPPQLRSLEGWDFALKAAGSEVTGSDGVIKLLNWQIGGSRSGPLPNSRWMETDQISDAQLLDQTFLGDRPTPSGKHHKWDELFLRVKPADTSG
jgi:hypothetical protein